MKDNREKIIENGLKSLGLLGNKQSISWHSGSLFEMYRITLEQDERTTELAAKVMNSETMAIAEMNGLRALAETGCNVPQTYGTYAEKNYAVMYMDFIPSGFVRNTDQYVIENLRKMYTIPGKQWGWGENNFIGSLGQTNSIYSSFTEFYLESRLKPQLVKAIDAGLLNQGHMKRTETLLQKFSAEWKLDKTLPRLIHGDLWNGNILPSADGKVYFIDPSVAWSHPEQDFAMLNLFGSVVKMEQMEELTIANGMPEGLAERLPFWQIYPLLVHVNIFGASYVGAFERVLKTYLE